MGTEFFFDDQVFLPRLSAEWFTHEMKGVVVAVEP